MAAPAALAFSKLSYPEVEESKTTSKHAASMLESWVLDLENVFILSRWITYYYMAKKNTLLHTGAI